MTVRFYRPVAAKDKAAVGWYPFSEVKEGFVHSNPVKVNSDELLMLVDELDIVPENIMIMLLNGQPAPPTVAATPRRNAICYMASVLCNYKDFIMACEAWKMNRKIPGATYLTSSGKMIWISIYDAQYLKKVIPEDEY